MGDSQGTTLYRPVWYYPGPGHKPCTVGWPSWSGEWTLLFCGPSPALACAGCTQDGAWGPANLGTHLLIHLKASVFPPRPSQGANSGNSSWIFVPPSLGSPGNTPCSLLPTLHLQMIWAALERSWVCPGGGRERNHFVTGLKALQGSPALMEPHSHSSESLALGQLSPIPYNLEASIFVASPAWYSRDIHLSLPPAVSINKVSGNLSVLLIPLPFQLTKSHAKEGSGGPSAQVRSCHSCSPSVLFQGAHVWPLAQVGRPRWGSPLRLASFGLLGLR